MKRSLTILILGFAAAAVAYCAFYFGSTANERAMLKTDEPELAWLKKEFNLSDAESKRITELHEAYMPHCEEMCARINRKNAEIKALLDSNNAITPAVEQKLNEAAQLRAECHKQMLAHFIEVSKAMPPEQGKRYLAWIESKTILQGGGMMHSSSSMDMGHE